jgi:hypothetical protein
VITFKTAPKSADETPTSPQKAMFPKPNHQKAVVEGGKVGSVKHPTAEVTNKKRKLTIKVDKKLKQTHCLIRSTCLSLSRPLSHLFWDGLDNKFFLLSVYWSKVDLTTDYETRDPIVA